LDFACLQSLKRVHEVIKNLFCSILIVGFTYRIIVDVPLCKIFCNILIRHFNYGRFVVIRFQYCTKILSCFA
jgi:hypothetical protein